MIQDTPVILFDFDGVILDSAGSQRVMQELLSDPHFHWKPLAEKSLDPVTLVRTFEESSRSSNLASLKAMYLNFLDILPSKRERWLFFIKAGRRTRRYEWKYNSLLPKVPAVLEELHKKGILMGIITNSSSSRLTKWLERTGIASYFSVFITRDNRKAFGVKPSPKPILGAIKQLKDLQGWTSVDFDRIAYVGDNITDIQAANAAKVVSIAVKTGHGNPQKIREASPSFYFDSIADLLPRLEDVFPDTSI